MPKGTRKPRISIEVDPDLQRRLKIVAAQHGVTIRDYVVAAVENALAAEDRAGWTQLSEAAFARDWNAEGDEVYDRLGALPHSRDHVITDWKGAGLLKPSLAQTKIATVEQGMITRWLGRLSGDDWAAVERGLRTALELG